jgi:hypothetical protein
MAGGVVKWLKKLNGLNGQMGWRAKRLKQGPPEGADYERNSLWTL